MTRGRLFPTHLACLEKNQPRASRALERARVLVSSSFNFCEVCDFPTCGASRCVLLAQLRCELVQVLLRFLLTVKEYLEEICLRARQGVRPHGHGLDVFLRCFGFS